MGDDPHGARARAALAAEGVEVADLAVVDAPTGVALITVAEDGENHIAVASGANEHVDPAAAARAVDGLDDPARAVLLLGLEVPDAPSLAAAARARERGVRVVLDPAPARAHDPMLLRGALLTPNEHEAATLTGEREPAAAARTLVERTGAPVVLTLGARGALLLEAPGSEPVLVTAPRVDALDATGAGDAFTGALAAALAGGAELRAAVEAAVAAASASVTRPGAR